MGEPILLKREPNWRLIIMIALTLVGLNVLDALATLLWISIGIEEGNPFMGYILQYDTSLFVALKTAGIALAAAFLAYCAVKRYMLAYAGLILLSVVYLYPFAVHAFLYAYTSIK